MDFRENFINELFKINESNFNKKALALFNYQFHTNPVYARYARLLNKTPQTVQHLDELPFLPVTFFKSEQVISAGLPPQRCFYSSGTTEKSTRSKHYLADTGLYENVFLTIFEAQYGPVDDYILLALLPSYQENQDSSLLYMIQVMIEKTGNPQSSFLSNDYAAFMRILEASRASGKKILLIGVAYALLELAEHYQPDLSDIIVMETGGMKGRRKEMVKQELHTFLCEKFNVGTIHSEYGMTELLSQAYSKGNGIFENPAWMKVLIRTINDPFEIKTSGRGALNLIDLANIDSCAFIEIQDLAHLHPDGTFEILGRMDNSELRGCNMLHTG
jgi:hypothetical protein